MRPGFVLALLVLGCSGSARQTVLAGDRPQRPTAAQVVPHGRTPNPPRRNSEPAPTLGRPGRLGSVPIRSLEAAPPPPLQPTLAPEVPSNELATLPTGESPISFEAAAPDGSWVLFCEARADSDGDGRVAVRVGPRGELGGDALRRRLIAAPSFDRRIDDLLVSSADGRRLLVSRGGELFLVENGTEQPIALPGADLAHEPGMRSGHRTLAIAGDNLFYVRASKKQSELVVRDLISGGERVEYRGPEPVLRLEVYDQGNVVILRVPGPDRNQNGRFDRPFTPSAQPRPCPSPLSTYLAEPKGADPLGVVVVDRRNRSAKRVDDLVMPFGTGLLRRSEDGTLILERAGNARVLADSTCAGRVVFADSSRDLMLLGCSIPKNPVRLQIDLVAGGTRTPLGFDLAALALDEPDVRPERAVPIYPGADSALFDLEKKKLVPLSPGDNVLHMVGTRALVRRGRSLLFFGLESAEETPIPGKLDPYGGVLLQGSMVYASPFVIDVARGKVLGKVPGPALALTRSGALLLPAAPATADQLARGPLRWQWPSEAAPSRADRD